jgi:hypothetical protein
MKMNPLTSSQIVLDDYSPTLIPTSTTKEKNGVDNKAVDNNDVDTNHVDANNVDDENDLKQSNYLA